MRINMAAWMLGFSMILMCAEAAFEDAGLSLQIAAEYMKMEQWSRAETVLNVVVKENPEFADGYALRGMARYHQAKYEQALNDLEKAVKGERYGSRVLYYKGLCLSRLNKAQEAQDVFTDLIMTYPASAETRRVGGLPDEIVEQLTAREGPALQQPFAMAQAGYDSNPSLRSGGSGDMVVNLYGSSRLTFENHLFSIGGSGYIEKYFSETDSDFMVFSLDADRPVRLADSSQLEPSVILERSWSGGDAYEMITGLQAHYEKVLNADWNSEARLRYYLVSGLDDQDDASRYSLRARAWRKCDFGSMQRMRFNGQWSVEDSDAGYLSYDSLSFGLQCRFALPSGTTLDAGIELGSRGYNEENPAYLETREDTSIELSAVAIRSWTNKLLFRAEASILSRDSNIDDYSCTRFLVNAGVLYVP